MKIKAKVGPLERDVIIIDFVSAYNHDVKAVYVTYDGKVDDCYIDDVIISDRDYIPGGR